MYLEQHGRRGLRDPAASCDILIQDNIILNRAIGIRSGLRVARWGLEWGAVEKISMKHPYDSGS